jgi:hypothetical protein
VKIAPLPNTYVYISLGSTKKMTQKTFIVQKKSIKNIRSIVYVQKVFFYFRSIQNEIWFSDTN